MDLPYSIQDRFRTHFRFLLIRSGAYLDLYSGLFRDNSVVLHGLGMRQHLRKQGLGVYIFLTTTLKLRCT